MTNTLYDALFAKHESSDRPFLHLLDGSTLTYGEFCTRAGQFAGALAGLGVAAGDRVAVQIEKSPDALAVYAACVRLGAVFLPLNTAYAPPEVAYFLGDSGAKVFLCDPAKRDLLTPVAQQTGAAIHDLGVDGAGSFADLRSDDIPPVAPRGADDLAAFLYTSGTTGRSKGAMLSQGNLLSNAQVLTDSWRFTTDDTLLHALPIFHTHGLFVGTNITLLAGGSMIFLPKFEVAAMIGQMSNATTMMGVPTFYTRLLDQPSFNRELTAGMRLFISGSAPLLAETHRQFEARTGHRILERYGMTETNMNTSNPYAGERRAGTVGVPLPGVEVRLRDKDSGVLVSAGEIGVVEVRGANVFQGYWNMPEKTAAELREDGFFITGDLGVMDDDGYLTIVGRDKDLIISGGFNIYPKEVELLLDTQPGVLESAVIGVPHPDLGEAVLAVLAKGDGVPDHGAVGASLTTDLARFKQPRDYVTVDALPRNTMGKVQKNVLRETYKDWFQKA